MSTGSSSRAAGSLALHLPVCGVGEQRDGRLVRQIHVPERLRVDRVVAQPEQRLELQHPDADGHEPRLQEVGLGGAAEGGPGEPRQGDARDEAEAPVGRLRGRR